MKISFNLDEKMLKRVSEEMGIEYSELVDNVESYFKSYEYNSDLIEELIENVIVNY